MEYMRLPTKHPCWSDFIYSCNIYSDIVEGNPNAQSGIIALEKLEALAEHFSSMVPIYNYDNDKIGKQILLYRGNLALIDDAVRRGMIIWFDNGLTDARVNLASIIDAKGLENITEEYFF